MTLASAGVNAVGAGVSLVRPDLAVPVAALQPLAMHWVAKLVGARTKRLNDFTEGGPEWQESVAQLANDPAGIALLEALLADAEDEKIWAYRSLGAEIGKGGFEHDQAIRFVGLLKALRQKQILRLVYFACLKGLHAAPAWPYGQVDEGAISHLVAAECYAADIPGGFDLPSLNREGRAFVNILRESAPIAWEGDTYHWNSSAAAVQEGLRGRASWTRANGSGRRQKIATPREPTAC